MFDDDFDRADDAQRADDEGDHAELCWGWAYSSSSTSRSSIDSRNTLPHHPTTKENDT